MFNKNIAAARDTLIHFATRDSVWGNRLVLVPEFRTVRSSDSDTEPATVHLTLKDETGTLLYRRDYTMADDNRLTGRQYRRGRRLPHPATFGKENTGELFRIQ